MVYRIIQNYQYQCYAIVSKIIKTLHKPFSNTAIHPLSCVIICTSLGYDHILYGINTVTNDTYKK